MADESTDTSDVELEGMDVDEEEEELEDEDDGIPQVAAAAVAPPSPAVEKTLHDEERRDIEAARRERTELLAAESKKIQPPATKQEQLDYLMAQSDVFAHFLAGTRRVGCFVWPTRGKMTDVSILCTRYTLLHCTVVHCGLYPARALLWCCDFRTPFQLNQFGIIPETKPCH